MNTTLPSGEPHCPVCRTEMARRLVGRHERRTCPNGHGSAVARLNGMYDGYEWVFTPTKETV